MQLGPLTLLALVGIIAIHSASATDLIVGNTETRDVLR